MACSSSDDNDAIIYEGDCDFATLINPNLFENASSAYFDFTNISIDGDCMQISFGANGCGADTFDIRLIDSGVIMESFPPQRRLRFVIQNTDIYTCPAYFEESLSFDLTPIQVDEGVLMLTIEDYPEQVEYEF